MANAAKIASRTRQGTILVVEDELRSQRLLRLNLEPLGYRIITLDQGRDAAEMVDTHTPTWWCLTSICPTPTASKFASAFASTPPFR